MQILDVTIENYLEKIAECISEHPNYVPNKITLLVRSGESAESIRKSIKVACGSISGFYCGRLANMLYVELTGENWRELVNKIAKRYPPKVGNFTKNYLFSSENNSQPTTNLPGQFVSSGIDAFEPQTSFLNHSEQTMPLFSRTFPDTVVERSWFSGQNDVTVPSITSKTTKRPQKRPRIIETMANLSTPLSQQSINTNSSISAESPLKLDTKENTRPIFNNEGEPIYTREKQRLIVKSLIVQWHDASSHCNTYSKLESELKLRPNKIWRIREYGEYLYSHFKTNLYDYLILNSEALANNAEYLENLAELEVFKGLTNKGEIIFNWENELRIIESLIQNWALTFLNTNIIDQNTINVLAQQIELPPERVNAIWENQYNLTHTLKMKLFQYMDIYFAQNAEFINDTIKESLEKLRVFQNSVIENQNFYTSKQYQFNLFPINEKTKSDSTLNKAVEKQPIVFANNTEEEQELILANNAEEAQPIVFANNEEKQESNLSPSREEPQLDLTDEEVAFLLRMP